MQNTLFQKEMFRKKFMPNVVFGVLFLLTACGSDGSIGIELYVPASPNQPNSNVFGLASTVQIEVLQDGKVKRERTFEITEQTGEAGLIPFKEGVQIKVTALSGDEPPVVLGRGGTGLLDLSQEDDASRLGILVGRVQTFFPTTDINDNSIATEMGIPRVGMTATEISGGRVLLAGGTTLNATGQPIGEDIERTLEIYDPSTGSYQRLVAELSAPRAFHTATRLADGRVLLAGGLSNQGSNVIITSGTADIFDPATCGNPFSVERCEITPIGDGRLTLERAGHTATLLANNKVLFVGGFRQNGGAAPEFIQTAELVTVGEGSTAVFEGGGLMPEARGLHAAALLPDGFSVLVSGGRNGVDAFESMLIFRDGVGFIPAGVMTSKRFLHTMTPIGIDGQHFLIAGGFSAIGAAGQNLTPTATMDVADIQGNTINGQAPLGILPNGAIAEHMAARLDDGRVLIAGGSLTNNNSSDAGVVVRFSLQGEVATLDPAPTFEPLEFSRSKATILSHSNGGAFIFGGTTVNVQNGVQNLSSAEAFISDFSP